MKSFSVMLVAGEASGDAHAAGLVEALRPRMAAWLGARAYGCDADASGGGGVRASPVEEMQPLQASLAPRFFGAGGPRMAAAGVELHLDLVAHAVFGFVEVMRELRKFRLFFRRLVDLACVRQPDLIILVDSAGLNRRLAAAIRRRVSKWGGPFRNWKPRIVYFISPQVWASRESRAFQLARDVDLLLSIFPFERDWYARRVPELRVEFVGHPAAERYGAWRRESRTGAVSRVLLLPGSRAQELGRHLPVMIEAVRLLKRDHRVSAAMALPDARLLALAKTMVPLHEAEGWPESPLCSGHDQPITACIGHLPDLLSGADLALAKSGSITLECAWFRLPAVVIYRVAWPTWVVARRLVRVPHVAMPNILAGKRVYPELLQSAATPEAIAREASDLLQSEERRRGMAADLERVIESLGGPGAYRRAAEAIVRLLEEQRR